MKRAILWALACLIIGWVGIVTLICYQQDNVTESQKCFELINQERQRNGISQLQWNDNYAELASIWAKRMSDIRELEHSHGNYSENLALGFNNGEQLYQLWEDSSLHYGNLVNRQSKQGAVAIYSEKYKMTLMGFDIYYGIGANYGVFIAK